MREHLLLSLATTPERALRLMACMLDRLGPDCSDGIQVHVDGDGDGAISFSDLQLPGSHDQTTPERRFASIKVWLEGSGSQPHLVNAYSQQGGRLASSPDEAHLLVADVLELATVEARWPRKLVIPLAEFEALVIGDNLRPLRISKGTPCALPKPLRGIWNQLKSGSVLQILAGLDAFSALATDDQTTGDLLLEEVGVETATGTMVLGNRFQRVREEANAHLLYALLGLLSRSPEGSRGERLRQAVRNLEGVCPSLPELRGFIALRKLDLRLDYNYSDPDGAVKAGIAGQFDALPVLEILRLHVDDELQITSLDGLMAARLRELDGAGVGLTDIKALACNAGLETVSLWGNQKLSDITPLQASAISLRRLDISSTGIVDLSTLADAGELEELDLGSCHNLTSLKGLDRLTITKQQNFSISDLSRLTHLQYLPKLSSGHLALYELAGLTSLDGIGCAADWLTSLHVYNMPELKDVQALRQLKCLKSLVIDNCNYLTNVEVLGELPSLEEVDLRDCKKLSRLPAVWPSTLTSLGLDSCPINQLGTLPATLSGSLNLVSCSKLKSLEGIEACQGLQEITIRPSTNGLQALASLPNTWLHIDFFDQEHTLPEPLIEALAALPQCKLRITDSRSYWTNHITNPEALSKITNLRAVDLSHLELDSLSSLMSLCELELIKIRPRSALSKKVGGCTFDSPGKVAKLQLQCLGLS